MRKRNKATCWIVTVLMIFLMFFLVVSALLIWGRVFAASMPDSLITSLWHCARDNKLARCIMISVRNSALYDALCSFARSSDGTLEPLKFLLELFGFMSFVAGAVNEIKSTRSFGMMMSDVIHYSFPGHFAVQVLFYGLFAIGGGYACLKNIGIAAMICLCGIVVCFAYSVVMAYFLFGPQGIRIKIVKFYINGVMTRAISNPAALDITANTQDTKEKEKWQGAAGACVLDYAQFVGQQWNVGTALQIQNENILSLENFLIRLTICGLTANVEYFNEKNDSKAAEYVDMADSFTKVFDCPLNVKERVAEYVLFRKGLNFTNDSEIKAFRHDVQRCSKIWDRLLCEVENEKRRSQMVQTILREAQQVDWHIFSMLSFGLLNNMNLAKASYGEQISKETIAEKVDFIFDLLQAAYDTVPEEQSEDLSVFIDAWGEIYYLTAAIVQWMVVLNCVENEVGEWVENTVLPLLQKNDISEKCLSKLKRNKEKYVVFGYLLFSMKNPEKHKDLSAYMLQQLEPIVCQKMSLL